MRVKIGVLIGTLLLSQAVSEKDATARQDVDRANGSAQQFEPARIPKGYSAPSISAQIEQSEKQKRRQVVPYILALTKCLANVAANDDEAAQAYMNGVLIDYLTRHYPSCSQQLRDLLDNYDNVYGDGQAGIFLKGPYRSDLERAVLSLVQPQLDARYAALKNAEAARDAEQRSEAAEAERRATEEKAAAIAAEAERQAAETKARVEKQERIDVAKRSMAVLRDKFYDCADHQLVGLVKSGESADVLANASMTICGQSLSQLQDSAIEEVTIENGGAPGAMAEEATRLQIKSLVKERVVADAVQAKAGVGAFSTDPSSPGKF